MRHIGCFTMGIGLMLVATAFLLTLARTASAIIIGTTIEQAKQIDDGTPITLDGVIVTRVFGESFYVEADGRQSGLRVVQPGNTMQEGFRAQISGVIKTNPDGERYVEATSSTGQGPDSLGPLKMMNSALGGSDWLYNALTGAGQRGVTGGIGLNTIGLLVTGWGTVTESAPYEFRIDDLTVPAQGLLPSGVLVKTPDLVSPPVGSYVAVTGISSVQASHGGFIRTMLNNSAEQIIPVQSIVAGRASSRIVQTVNALLDSPHPVPDYYDGTFVVQYPSQLARMRAHFTAIQLDVFDTLTLFDGLDNPWQWFGVQSATDIWSNWIQGNTVKLALHTEDPWYYDAGRFGFQIDKWEVEGFLGQVPGVTLTLNPGNRTTTSDVHGVFAFVGISPGQYTVTPSLNGASFTPSSLQVTVGPSQFLNDLNFVKD